MNFILSIIILVCIGTQSNSSKILFLYPFATKSETHSFNALAQGLSNRGHEVTVVTPSVTNNPNITEIFSFKVEDYTGIVNGFEDREIGPWAITSFDFSYTFDLVRRVYENVKFQNAISKKYDLVFISAIMNDGFAGVIEKIGAPFVLIASLPPQTSTTRYTGNYLPSSFVPNPAWDLTHQMNFFQRLLNYFLSLGFGFDTTHLNPELERIYRSYLGSEVSDIETIMKNVSLIISNSHFTLNYPRPNLPDNIEVGGMHCGPSKPLPKDLNDFLSGAEHGFIFLSFGSVVKATDMPEETRQAFVNVFSRLKQRVLWKWENEHMPNLPKNVMVRKWLPQQDILGHKNIKLFITHGGLLSIQEAAYHGVPCLGLPFFFDQDVNVKLSVEQGFALFQEILHINEAELEKNIRTLLEDPKYYQRAKELSVIVKDQTETPLERAIFWSEYVIRHKGAKHLRSAARDLSYIQYHSYDILGLAVQLASLAAASPQGTICWL